MYYYFQREESNSSGGLKKKDFDLYDAADELWKLTKDEGYGSIRFLGEVKRARTAFSLLSKIAYYGIADQSIDKKEVIDKLTAEHRKKLWILLKSPITRSRKILCVAFSINFHLAKMIVRIGKRIKAI